MQNSFIKVAVGTAFFILTIVIAVIGYIYKDRQNSLNDLLAQIEVQIDELTLSDSSILVSKTVGELEIRGKGAFILVGLRRVDGELVTHPHSSLILNAQDTLIVLGHQEKLPKFARYYQLNHSLYQRRKTERIS